MARPDGSPRRPVLAAAAAAGALAALVVLVVATVSPAATTRSTAHKCLVMTGSGDPAFVRNFNPYTATGLPSGQFVLAASIDVQPDQTGTWRVDVVAEPMRADEVPEVLLSREFLILSERPSE